MKGLLGYTGVSGSRTFVEGFVNNGTTGQFPLD